MSASLLSIKEQDQKDAMIAELRAQNALLRQKIDALVKALYGAKSEKIDPAQLALELGINPPEKPEASSDETSAPEEANAEKRKTKSKGKNNSRVKGLDELETIEDTVFPSEVEANPDDYELIGQDVSEQLDYQPAKCFKRRTIRPKFRRKDRSAPPVVAPAPLGPLVKGLPTFALSSELIINKYCDHLPLYRQQQIFWRNGVDIPRDTLTHWTLSHLEILRPIGEAIHTELLRASYLQIDETPLDYLAPGNGKTKTGYLWVISSPNESVSYRWHTSRSKTALEATLGGDFSGLLQCDGYTAYTSYEKDRSQSVKLAHCMAHVRRKFYDAFEKGDKRASYIIRWIQQLYTIEEQLRESRADPQLRAALRGSHARPLLKRIKTYLLKIRPQHLPQSLLGKAITYALGAWLGFDAYLSDGRIEIDNNLIENAIRPTKLGQKNWLFIGSQRGGELAALAYTLIENCKRHGVNLRNYLETAARKLIEQGPETAKDLTPAKFANRSTAQCAA